MTGNSLLLSSAYFPPVQYMALAARAEELFIEKEENYLKQSYRNRCCILSANGPLSLSIPVLLGSFHKTRIKDIRIDYSKRWQQIHLGAITSSYRSSPYYEYYFERIKEVILHGDNFLLDLNMKSLELALKVAGIGTEALFTSDFLPPGTMENDFRYTISPKNSDTLASFRFGEYQQVFSDRSGFVEGLSIIDLILNTGPDGITLLKGTTFKTGILK